MSLSHFLKLFTQYKLIYPYSLFFGFFSGSLMTLWLTAYVANHGQHFQYRHAINSFGQVMANMIARQAMDATLNHDRLSLQILLEDITFDQIVVTSAIYDVENKLIVQAGETGNHLPNHIQHFSAPIVLHDTMSGHVVLGIDTAHPDSIRYPIILLLISGLLASTSVFCLYRGINQIQPVKDKEEKKSVKNSTTDEEEAIGNQSVLLTLSIKNFDDLYQKLNSDSRKRIIDKLFRHVQKALRLYNGDLVYIGSATIVLSFKKNHFAQDDLEINNAIFNAACCGYIVCKLNKQQSNFSIALEARIHHTPEKAITKERSLLPRHKNTASSTSLSIERFFLEDRELTSYFLINSEENHTNFVDIQGFQPMYADLLDNQLKYLQDIEE